MSLLRDNKEVEGTRRRIQNNVHGTSGDLIPSGIMYSVSCGRSKQDGAADIAAGQYFKPHRIVFEEQDELVQMAREGDRIVLWARAEFPVRSDVSGSSLAVFISSPAHLPLQTKASASYELDRRYTANLKSRLNSANDCRAGVMLFGMSPTFATRPAC